jgi:hypothetical protein
VSNYTFVPLTSLVAEQPAADALALSWPVTIGGYSMQSKSNLAAGLEVWQGITNPVVQFSNRNQVTIAPLPGSQNYRLKIDLNE